MQRLCVIYDGDCGFCMKSLGWVRRLDRFGTLEYFDFHDPSTVASRFPALVGADFENAMYVVSPTGKSYRGFYGFRRLSWNFPLTWLLVPLLYIPGVAWVGERAYRWVANNRHRLSGTGAACAVPPPRPNSSHKSERKSS